jgi:cytochrome c1
MPQPLMDGSIEYEDGTEATMSQMAKDVTVFLAWAAEPELDGVCTAFASSLHVCAALLVVQADVA